LLSVTLIFAFIITIIVIIIIIIIIIIGDERIKIIISGGA